MNSSERFITALENDIPDRVPIFLQMLMPKFEKKVENSLSVPQSLNSKFFLFNQDYKYLHHLGVDASWGYSDIWKHGDNQKKRLHVETLNFQNQQSEIRFRSDSYIDFEGRILRKAENNQIGFDWYVGNYISTVQQGEDWISSFFTSLPDIDHNVLNQLNQQIQVFPKQEFSPIFMLEKILEPIWQGFGLSVLAQLDRKKPHLLQKIIDFRKKLVEWQLDHLLELDFDVFCMEDASAFKNGPIVSHTFYKKYILPVYSAIVKKVHKAGKHIFFHSDGNFTTLIPHLINTNFEAVGSLEVNAGMELGQIKPKFGGFLTLIGNFNTDFLNSQISTEKIITEVKSTLSKGKSNGGYIFAPDADIFGYNSLQNLRTMIHAVKKYGIYD